MNKFQKIATRLAKHEVVMSGDEFLFRYYKNQIMKKFRKEKWKYPNIIEYKNFFIKWDITFNR
ncbi:Uncharacterised protein [uncultured Clostridium sp.]|nr:Uncharacterised protein [uncultured Clostridium sp.]